jgi:hypothetical protein
MGSSEAAAGLGDSEVEQFDHPVVGDHHVLLRHIAMDDGKGLPRGVGERMGVVQRQREFVHHRGGKADGKHRSGTGAGAGNLVEVLAGDELHRQKQALTVFAKVKDLADVRVIEGGGDPRFVEKHLHELIIVLRIGKDSLHHHVLSKTARARGEAEKQLGHSS